MPVVHNPIKTNSYLDVYPTHEAKLGKGGYRTVANIAERDTIPFERCEVGMLVTVLEDNTNNNLRTTYILKQITRDSRTWEKFINDKVDTNLTNRIAALETSSAKIDNEIVTLSNEISTKASLENHNNLVASLATYALKSDLDTLATKDELLTKADLSNLDNLASKDEVNVKLDTSRYIADKVEFATKNELNTLVYTKSQVDEKIATAVSGGSVNLDGFVRKDEIVNLVTKDELNDKLDISTYTTDKDTFATKDELNNKADRSELDTKANNSDLQNLATKAELSSLATKDELNLKADLSSLDDLATKTELGDYALKSDIPSGVTIDDEQIAKAVNSNSRIQELSTAVANLASNLQGATYSQLVATFNYLGYSLPTTLAIYDTYVLNTVSGEDATLTISVLEHTSGYSGLSNLAVYNDNNERLVIKSYIQDSEKVAKIILAPSSSDVNPILSEVTQTPQDYVLADKEVEVELNFSNNYPGYPAWYSALSASQYCSDGASFPVFNFTFKKFKPKRFEIKASYHDGSYAIVKANIAITHGALYNEPMNSYNKNSDNMLVVDMVNLDMNVNMDEKYRELVTAWNVVPKPFTPPRLVSFREFTSSLNVSKDNPFILTLKGTKIHTDAYGTSIGNIEFFINGNERLYPKYAQITSGDNIAEYILTKDESQKVNEMTPIPSDYDYKANNEYYVKAKRISAQFDSGYTFAEALLYTAPGGYDHEYLTGSGLVNIEFYCDFIPSKLQFTQAPYSGHGKAAGYETYYNGTKLTEVAYKGGSYEYEVHNFEELKFKVYDK